MAEIPEVLDADGLPLPPEYVEHAMAIDQHKVDVHMRMLTDRSWRRGQHKPDGELWAWRKKGHTVIWSIGREDDDQLWIHASLRRPLMPTYDDLVWLHRMFIGVERHAVQLFVPPAEHVSINDTCLHLWARVDGARITPDFTRGLDTI